VFLLLNKIDLLGSGKEKLLSLIDQFRRVHEFQEVLPISARRREGLGVLLRKIVDAMPEGPRYFESDQLTDQPMRFMVAEAIREQIMLATSEEVPYSTSVVVENFEEGARLTRISALIYCNAKVRRAS